MKRLLLGLAIVASLSCSHTLTSSGQILQTLHAIPLSQRDLTLVPTEGDEHFATYIRLLTFMQDYWVVAVVEVPDLTSPEGDPLFGTCSLVSRYIEVRKNMDPNMKLEVLLHEAAHFFQPRLLEDSVRGGEVWAEGVTYQVMKELKLPIGSQSLVYLSWLDAHWDTVRQHGDYFDQVVAHLVTNLKEP